MGEEVLNAVKCSSNRFQRHLRFAAHDACNSELKLRSKTGRACGKRLVVKMRCRREPLATGLYFAWHGAKAKAEGDQVRWIDEPCVISTSTVL